MDVVGNEIGQKMRSAIKAKLTELGCYVDDELPDYVMVMVANKRTRIQMEDDLQLFLGNNTELFVNWLHQVLKKLQEVTVAAPVLKVAEVKCKERSDSTLQSDPKDQNTKEKKSKQKKSDMKKAKKKDKEKVSRKKEDKKSHKTKKKSKHHEIIRPNIPPMLMNMEKDAEPSITDVFAGQILKNHGINLDPPKEDSIPETKLVIKDVKRPILPIIDPATISAQIEPEDNVIDLKEDPTKEISHIESKIQGLKQKLAEQLDSISDDEDFLNIRTEAEELMNDFAEDVFQEVTKDPPVIATPPPLELPSTNSPPTMKSIDIPKEPTKDLPDTLPQIELKLPKRPLRERLGAREDFRVAPVKEKEKTKSPERFTPDREPVVRSEKSAKSRLRSQPDTPKTSCASDDAISDKSSDYGSKRLTSKVSLLENRRSRSSCASVVRVRPRPRGLAPASSLLLRAVADAHKSLLNTPSTKIDLESQKVKRALVLPMRRCVDAQKIVIEVSADSLQEAGDTISLEGDMDSEDDKSSKLDSVADKEEYIPSPLTKRIVNNEYTPSRCNELRTTTMKDDTIIIDTINIHNAGGTDKKTQFIVTMDGYHPNAFLAKKLQTEGLLTEEGEIKNIDIPKPKTSEVREPASNEKEPDRSTENTLEGNKRLSGTSEDSATQVIIKKEEIKNDKDKTKTCEVKERTAEPVKKRKASPIVFDVEKKRSKIERQTETKAVRERTESVSSDHSHVTVTTVSNSHKYDSVPPLSSERKPIWCRAFPACRYGSSCAFAHPRCKFLAACTRRNCVYSHSPNAPAIVSGAVQPIIASHVVPVANYKTISSVVPNMCKFYPNCVNPSCHFYHPKPCRYGNNCANKLECNFYHADIPPKFRYTL